MYFEIVNMANTNVIAQCRTHEMKNEIVERNLSGAEFIFIKLIM